MSNPLVAEKQDSTSAISGISILEAGKGLKDGIESGDWAATVMGAVGVGMEALAAVMDPFGAILAAGVGWLIEHVGPLKEALDKLAGDPDQVHAYSETWKNVAKEVSSVSQDLAAQVKKDIESWEGASADAYRKQAEEVAKTLEGAAQACEGAGSGVKTAGEVVGAVRMLVRDIIAQVVAHLISWALQVLFTLGIGMAWVVPQVVNLVAKTAKQIAELVKNLTKALKELGKLLTKTKGLFENVAKSMKSIKGGAKDATHTPKEIKSPGGGSTKPSGAKDTPNEKGGGGGEKPPPGKDESTNTSGAHDGPPPENKGGGNHEPPPREPAKDEAQGNGGTEGGANKNERGGNERTDPDKDKTEASNAKQEGDADPPCLTDPVVISTGEVLVEDYDLELPDLLVRRTHRSSYRSGHWFGSTWASTVDQRLEFGEEYIRYYGPEGVVLYYPMPAGDEPVLPTEGARWPLTKHADGSCTIDQVRPDRTMRFSGEGKAFPLRSIEDADGARTELSYADSGAPELLTHSSGIQVGFRTDGHRITELRMIGAGPAPDVVVRSYRYNYRGHLSEVINSSGTAMRYTYDPDGRVTSWEDRNGVAYRYVYDAEGRCVRTEGDQGFYSGAFEFLPEARITRFTDSLGHVSEYEYNAEGRPVRETDPLGNVTLSEWDRYGNLLRRVDPLGRITEYTYDEDGTPLTIARPDGSLAELEHDGVELASITVHGDGRIWQRRYDQPAVPELPGFLGEAEVSDEELDQFGRPRTAPEVGGGRVQLGWTVDGKPASRVGVRRERAMWRYDREGNEIEHVDELGRATKREYGPFDMVTAVVDPSGARTSYTYDTELRLTSVTDPLNRTWSYTYDPLGRLVAQTDFDGRTRTYAYDAAGQTVAVTEPDGSVTENKYDLLGNRIEIRGPHRTVRYTYDPVGNVVRAESADSVVEFDRDLYGRVVREAIDGVEVHFAYDEESQTIRRRTPSGAESVWTFDEEDRPVSLATAGHTVRYRLDDEGRVLARDTDGISTLQQAFGPRGLVTAQQVSRGTSPVRRRGLEYYADGSLAAVQDSLAGKTVYTRDPAGRVVTVSSAAGTEELRYNPAGELTAWSGSSGLAADYDALGRRIRHREVHPGGVRVWEYSWTGELLTGLRTPDGAQWRYRYDPLGRRIAKERLLADGSVAESTRFVWDGFVLIEQEHTDPSGARRTTTWERRPGSDEPVTQFERGPGGDRFASVVTDAIGTPTELIDEHGGLAWSARRSLWGRVQPGGIPLQFPGQYADAESGLHYNVFRYYDPAVARYISQDPLGLEGGPNPSNYVPDPFAATDVLGLKCNKGKGKDTDPPPADSTAKHNADNGGGSSSSANKDKAGDKRKRDKDDDGSSGSDGKSNAKKKKDDVWDRMAWNSDAKNARKDQIGNKNDPFHKAGSDVAQRHIISFQKMRDGLKNWVHEQPTEKQSALTKKYGEEELPKLHNQPKNLPLGPQHTNAGIGGVSTRIGNIEDGIAGKLKVGKNDKITTEQPKWPSDSMDKSGGYKHKDHPDLDKNWRPIGQQADRITDPKEMNRATRDIGDSADFDWPGGNKKEFEQWHKSFLEFTDLKENPKNYTQKDVDDIIDRFHNLPSPSGRHPTIDEYNKAPDGHPYRFDDKGNPVKDINKDSDPDWKRPDKPVDGNQTRTEWGNRNEQGVGPTKKDWNDLENGKYDPEGWNDPAKKKYLDEVGEPSTQDVKDAAAEAKAKSDKLAEDARKNRGW